MQRTNTHLAAIIGMVVVCDTAGALLMAQDGDFAAPATVSKEAKAAIEAFSRTTRNNPLPTPDDLVGWKKAQAGVEEDFAEASESVTKQYQPQIEERRIGGVPVLDIKPREWKKDDRVLVYTHGGAYTLFSAKSTLNSAVPVANDTGLRVIHRTRTREHLFNR